MCPKQPILGLMKEWFVSVVKSMPGFTALRNGHLLYHSGGHKSHTAGVGFLINKKWRDNLNIIEPAMYVCITCVR